MMAMLDEGVLGFRSGPLPRLADGQVLLSCLNVEEILDRADVGWLSKAERSRAAAFFLESKRREFLAGRLLLRRLVAVQHRVGCCMITCAPHGGPTLGGCASDLHCSIAHRKGKVAVALSRAGAVGVDVEKVLPGRAQALASRLSSAGVTQDMGAERLYAGWCECEALAKLRGEPLPSLLVTWPVLVRRYGLPPSGPSTRHHSAACIHHVELEPGWRLALSTEAHRVAAHGALDHDNGPRGDLLGP